MNFWRRCSVKRLLRLPPSSAPKRGVRWGTRRSRIFYLWFRDTADDENREHTASRARGIATAAAAAAVVMVREDRREEGLKGMWIDEVSVAS